MIIACCTIVTFGVGVNKEWTDKFLTAEYHSYHKIIGRFGTPNGHLNYRWFFTAFKICKAYRLHLSDLSCTNLQKLTNKVNYSCVAFINKAIKKTLLFYNLSQINLSPQGFGVEPDGKSAGMPHSKIFTLWTVLGHISQFLRHFFFSRSIYHVKK